VKVKCSRCGLPKEACLFTPGELAGARRCRKCVSLNNERRNRSLFNSWGKYKGRAAGAIPPRLIR
jgi:hypothetical protein